MHELTKKEKRQLAKEKKQEIRESQEKAGKLKHVLLWLLIILSVLWLGRGIFSTATAEKPGEEIADMGAEHVTDISTVTYNSNPPTSGPHFPVWSKPGIYDHEISDGYLIHSLEHGYIVVSYNCNLPAPQASSLIPKAYAHEEGDDIPADLPHPDKESLPLMQMRLGLDGKMSAFTPENAPDSETELPESFSSDACNQLRDQLVEFFNQNTNKRLIIVPRTANDSLVAITAWTNILKLENWDSQQAQDFLNAFHNRGPEQTVE
jgi:hypothetical protein